MIPLARTDNCFHCVLSQKNVTLKFFTVAENEITPEVIKRMERGALKQSKLSCYQPGPNAR